MKTSMQTTMLFFHYPDKIEVTYPDDESVYDSFSNIYSFISHFEIWWNYKFDMVQQVTKDK